MMAKIKVAAVDTELANEYLKNNKIFKSKGFNDSKELGYSGRNIAVQFSEYKRTTGSVILRHDINEVPEKLYNLAKKIEENVDLFCQLELLIRKIPLEDTKNIDLKLIIQNLIYYSSSGRPQVAKTCAREIVLNGNSPLLVLGCVAQVLIARMPRVVIECTKETAPVCSLFTDLCHGVGLKEKVLLAILPQNSKDNMLKLAVDFKNITDFLDGGLGIVSGKSDVDSAVDTFLATSCRYQVSPRVSCCELQLLWEYLNSHRSIADAYNRSLAAKAYSESKWKEVADQLNAEGEGAYKDWRGWSKYPWALKKIFVQECVLERFKRALAWKSEKQQLGTRGGDVEVSGASSYRCGDKVFVLEATGECGPCVVALEVYRTVRELLALVGALRPLAASLWCSDVAESLEIAHGLSATIVWVNAFADFRGPPRVSQAFYSVIDSYFSTQMVQYIPEFDEITKFRDSWLRLGVDERKDLVRNALSKIDDEEAKRIIEVVETLTFEVDSFVYVTKDMVSTGVELLPEIILPSYYYYNRLDLSIICYIIKGGAVVLHTPESSLTLKKSSIFYMFYENLRILGGPVLFSKEDYKHGTIPILRNPIYRKKVIWTSYGTIFAN